MTFTDGVALDEYFETTEGPFWVTGKVHIVSTHLFLGDLLIYPMTGKAARIGVSQLLGIVRILTESMKAQACNGILFRLIGCTLTSPGVSSQ